MPCLSVIDEENTSEDEISSALSYAELSENKREHLYEISPCFIVGSKSSKSSLSSIETLSYDGDIDEESISDNVSTSPVPHEDMEKWSEARCDLIEATENQEMRFSSSLDIQSLDDKVINEDISDDAEPIKNEDRNSYEGDIIENDTSSIYAVWSEVEHENLSEMSPLSIQDPIFWESPITFLINEDVLDNSVSYIDRVELPDNKVEGPGFEYEGLSKKSSPSVDDPKFVESTHTSVHEGNIDEDPIEEIVSSSTVSNADQEELSEIKRENLYEISSFPVEYFENLLASQSSSDKVIDTDISNDTNAGEEFSEIEYRNLSVVFPRSVESSESSLILVSNARYEANISEEANKDTGSNSTVSVDDEEEWSEIVYENLSEFSPRSIQDPEYLKSSLSSVYNAIQGNVRDDSNGEEDYQYHYIDAEGVSRPEIFIINYRPAIPSSEIPKTASSVLDQDPELPQRVFVSKWQKFCGYWKYILLGLALLLALIVAGTVITLVLIQWGPNNSGSVTSLPWNTQFSSTTPGSRSSDSVI